jgi:hypothetical protein
MESLSTAPQAAIGDLDLDDILSLEAFVRRYGDLADEPRLRWWIFNRRLNGLESSGAVVKKAGRWFVVPKRLKNWLLQAA